MKSLFKNLLLFSIIGVFCVSCNKNEDLQITNTNIFPITVYPTSVTSRYHMRMFVGGVEITDTIKIRKFYSTVPTKLTPAYILTLFTSPYIFKSKDSLQFQFGSSTGFNYIKINDKHVVALTNYSLVNPFSNPPAPSDDSEKFFFYKTVVVPYASGFNITRDIIGYGDYTSYKMPVLNYKYHKLTPDSFTSTGLINNEFDISTVNKLGPTDTLVVQESFLNYAPKSNL